MLQIDFEELETPKDWADALEKILNEAKVARQNNDSATRLHLQSLLTTFIEKAPVVLDPLARIARKAARDIFEEQIAASLEALNKRSEELKKAIKDLEGATAAAKASAESIQFKQVTDALDKAKSAVETLKELQADLAAPNQTLLQRIESVISAIEELQSLIKSDDD